MQPKLIVEQQITAFVNKYAVYQADGAGQKNQLLAFAQQKRLAFKEKVTFFSDESQSQEVFSFSAKKMLDVHGRYVITDSSNQPVGAFRKVFGKSLFVSNWEILDNNDKPLLFIKDSNAVLAVIRRFVGLIPVIGDVMGYVILLFKYHFDFVDATSGEIIGKYEKTTLFRDNYTLSVTDSTYDNLDWRTYAAVAVALDALQSR